MIDDDDNDEDDTPDEVRLATDYEAGLISRDDALRELIGMGYTDEEADEIIAGWPAPPS
jgi:hypothetical protein